MIFCNFFIKVVFLYAIYQCQLFSLTCASCQIIEPELASFLFQCTLKNFVSIKSFLWESLIHYPVVFLYLVNTS